MKAGWKTLPLSKAFWFQEGPGVRKWQFTNSGIKLLNVANIEKSGTLNLSKTDRHLSKTEVESKYSHFLIDDGDLVIASSGISFDEDGLLRTRGAFVEAAHLPLCLNTSTIRFKDLEDVSDLRFLRFWLDSLEFRSQITRLVTGSAQQNFGPSHLKSLQISLPPIAEQKRIAAILDKAEELRGLRRKALEQLDAIAQSIFLKMFSDLNLPERTIGELLESGSLLLHKDGNHGSLYPRADDFSNEGIPFLSAKSVTDDGLIDTTLIEYLREEKAEKLKIGWLTKGDVLLAHNASVGKVALYDGRFERALIGTSLTAFRPNPKNLESHYLTAVLQSTRFQQQLMKNMGQTTRNQVPITAQRGLRIVEPPLLLQQEFARRIEAIEQLKTAHRKSIAQLDALFASLQHRAFRGEL